MYCNPVFIILIKYHRVKETQQISRVGGALLIHHHHHFHRYFLIDEFLFVHNMVREEE